MWRRLACLFFFARARQATAGVVPRMLRPGEPAGFVFEELHAEEAKYLPVASLLAAAGGGVRVLDNASVLEVGSRYLIFI